MSILVLILVLLVTAAISFAATFTLTTFYITYKRRDKPRYHFTDAPDVPSYYGNVDHSSPSSSVDGSSAQGERTTRDAN